MNSDGNFSGGIIFTLITSLIASGVCFVLMAGLFTLAFGRTFGFTFGDVCSAFWPVSLLIALYVTVDS